MSDRQLFQCEIRLDILVDDVSDIQTKPAYLPVAKLDYDPGLQEGEEVEIVDFAIGMYPTEKFKAKVKHRSKQIIPGTKTQGDVFKVIITLHDPVGESLDTLREAFRKKYPGDYRYRSSSQ
jgi:hypothetical protein